MPESNDNPKQPFDLEQFLEENGINDLLILEQIKKEPAYFLKLMGMNREEITAEVTRLEGSTRHYREATGDQLDWWWPMHEKRSASEDCQRLMLARKMLAKYDEAQALKATHLDEAMSATKTIVDDVVK